MQKLLISQANVDYYGFFTSPAFDLIGDPQKILKGLYDTFSAHNIGLNNFRIEGDLSEPSTQGVLVRLGRFGTYRFKFDQVQATINGFSDSDLEGMVSAVDSGDRWLREQVKDLRFKNHIFLYASHGRLSGATSSEFLLSLPRRNLPVLGEDLGSGLLETWRDTVMDAKVRISIDHSLQEVDGLFLNYMVAFERDNIDYFDVARKARALLEVCLEQLGVEFGEVEETT